MKKLLLINAILLIAGCVQITPALDMAYQRAVQDAAFVKDSEVTSDLVAINEQNPHLVWNDDNSKILVVTWKEQSAFDKFLKPNHAASSNPDHATWVTAAPQVKQFCQTFLAEHPQARSAELELRLKQYLGLEASWRYDVFVEMWVAPQDLFRPCVDPEVSDSQCNTQFATPLPQVKNLPDYQSFYKNLYFKSFRASSGVPWTGLGYTYDWGNPQTAVGASEFILAPKAAYEIKQAVPTWEYCQAGR